MSKRGYIPRRHDTRASKMKKKTDSPYTAAITGGGFLFEETEALLPLLRSADRKSLLREEALNNNLLHVNSESSRKRYIAEIARRYDAMPVAFWEDYKAMDEERRRVALFFVILKTYKICFDLHVRVTMRKWNGIAKSLDSGDLMMEFREIAAGDGFVDSWSECTRKKVAGAYLSILRKAGMLDDGNELRPVMASGMDYYIRAGEPWFLEACLLRPCQIDNIKRMMT